MSHITQINLYPIKSTQPITVSKALVQPYGLEFDRTFMLTEPDGSFISARKDGELFAFSAVPSAQGLHIHHQDGSSVTALYHDFSRQAECQVWGNHFDSLLANDNINSWFSEKLQRAVQLRWLGFEPQRRIKRYPEQALSFADGYPLLLTNLQSLASVQQHCPVEISMTQFRANLVIDNAAAFSENQWQKIRIGEVEFINAKPCIRCILTTRDPQTAELQRNMEPFRTLKKHFADSQGQPVFGINLVPLNCGMIRIGDSLQILE
ncbi:MOSC domain-containing protein [Pasteurellaceae bacterium USgator11]|nr:MOSC domain-containing protein [Pasteurellaceae bacterium UScroc12]TNG97518.1 MOSC domain-containing protein [Pasteurellaceae bacterium USgator41]TNG99326.1 MOSC domain-containing protein [Pasteurellaceae bacterium USgator11]TNG99570.1 MOSC domain-containing protein [Pasteurellaceae bacterium UScroc31]